MPEKLFESKLDVKNFNEAIEVLGGHLLDSNYVKESYIEAVLEREKTLPTGLNIGQVNVAIPHTDVNHVNTSAIGVATLKEPVKFKLMEDPTKEINVDIIFLLAVKDPKEQVVLLKKLMTLFQNENLLIQMKNAENVHQLDEVLRPALS